MYYFYPHGRRWLTEVRRDQIDLKINVTSKDLNSSNELPEELYMTHTYKFALKLENYLESRQKEGGDDNRRPAADLIFCIEALDSDTLTQAICSDPTKKMLSGLTRVRVSENDIESPVFLKIKFMESNYSKKIKLPSNGTSPSSPPICGASFHSLMKAGTSGSSPPGFILGNAAPTSSTATATNGGPPPSANLDSLMSASNNEPLVDPILLKKQIEALNAQSFDFFRLRIIVYEVKLCSSTGTPGLPIISKVSAPFKVYSKKQHAKKKKKNKSEGSKKAEAEAAVSESEKQNNKRMSVKQSSMASSTTNPNKLAKRP